MSTAPACKMTELAAEHSVPSPLPHLEDSALPASPTLACPNHSPCTTIRPGAPHSGFNSCVAHHRWKVPDPRSHSSPEGHYCGGFYNKPSFNRSEKSANILLPLQSAVQAEKPFQKPQEGNARRETEVWRRAACRWRCRPCSEPSSWSQRARPRRVFAPYPGIQVRPAGRGCQNHRCVGHLVPHEAAGCLKPGAC